MEKKYIVGIDFGNGETSAWCTPIDDNASDIQPSGSVRLMNANAPGERKIRTAIKLTKDGRFSTTEPGAVLIGLKSKISALDEQKKSAYKAFIKDIYKRIIVNNPHLVDNGNGDSNFYICIASPTKWNEEDQQEYIRFFNNALTEFHQEVLWVINESDAAYFAHRDDNKNVLVVDFGSSTIDYTLISHGMKVSDDKWSNDYLGAREIERAMLESYRTSPNSNFQNAKLATEQILRQTGNNFYDVRATLEYELRREKERAYTNYNPNNLRRPYDYKFSYDFYEETGEMIFDDDQYNFKHKGFFRGENGVCEAYIKAVRDDFAELKQKIQRSGIANIDNIILSGGACIMGWVQEEIIKVFGTNVRIILDTDPEYVVSKGIALYAKAQMQALVKLQNTLRSIDFRETYKQADLKATLLATEELFPPILNEIEGSSDLTCNEIFLKIANFFYGLNSLNEDYKILLTKCINDELTIKISSYIKSAIKDVFSIEVDTSDVKSHIDVQVMNFKEEFFTEGNGGRIIYELLADATGPHIFTDFDPEKRRSIDVRRDIVRKCKSKFFTSDPFGVGYEEDDLNAIAEEVKTISINEAEKIFYKKQLFTTTFKK